MDYGEKKFFLSDLTFDGIFFQFLSFDSKCIKNKKNVRCEEILERLRLEI